MKSLLEQLTDWLKDMLVGGIRDNLTSTFSTLNQKIGEVTAQVAQTPDQFQPTVYNLIRNLSENVILPIAGIILTFIACYELIQLVIAHNNLANFETWIFFKWVFKTFVAVTLITNTFNITMAVFDVAQHVVITYCRKYRSGRFNAGNHAKHIRSNGCGTVVWYIPAVLCREVLIRDFINSDLGYRLRTNDRDLSRVQKRRFSSKGGVRAFWEPGFNKPVKKGIKDVKSVTLASSDLPQRETTRGTIAYRKNRKLGKPSTHD